MSVTTEFVRWVPARALCPALLTFVDGRRRCGVPALLELTSIQDRRLESNAAPLGLESQSSIAHSEHDALATHERAEAIGINQIPRFGRPSGQPWPVRQLSSAS